MTIQEGCDCACKSKASLLQVKRPEAAGERQLGENKLFQIHLHVQRGSRHRMPTETFKKSLGDRWEVLPSCFD